MLLAQAARPRRHPRAQQPLQACHGPGTEKGLLWCEDLRAKTRDALRGPQPDQEVGGCGRHLCEMLHQTTQTLEGSTSKGIPRAVLLEKGPWSAAFLQPTVLKRRVDVIGAVIAELCTQKELETSPPDRVCSE